MEILIKIVDDVYGNKDLKDNVENGGGVYQFI